MATTDRLQGFNMGVAVKPPCVVASTAALTLSGAQTVDGIAVGSCERVLVRSQSDSKENGIYVSDGSAWRRAPDWDGKKDAIPGTMVYVDRGTTFGRVFFAANSSSTAVNIDIGATGDDLAWSQITPSVTDVSAGTVIADGTSAERALSARFAEQTNILNYRDLASTSNWSPAFDAALASVPSNVGLKLIVPIGEYPCVDELPARSNCWVDGDGEGTFLDFSSANSSNNGFVSISSAINDFRLTNMRIRGASPNAGDVGDSAGNGIYIDTTGTGERIKIHNVRIERFRQGVFIKADGKNENPEVVNCFVDECSQTGIRLQNCKWALVHGNTVDSDRTGIGDSTASVVGISLPTSDPGTECTFGRVSSNSIRGGFLESMIIQGKHIAIVGNTIDDPGTAGILVESPKTSTTKEHGKLYCTVTANTISGSSDADGIRLQHDPANNAVGVGYTVVEANTILGCDIGIRVGQTGSTDQVPFDNSINDNVIVGTVGRAIDVDDSVGTSLDGNRVIESVGSAIGVRGNAARTSITGGYLNATGTDSDGIIILENATDTHIAGVTFANCNRFGVRVSGTPVDVVVTANHFLDDQGVPTMDNAVAPTNASQNVQVWGNYSQGSVGDPYAGALADPQKFQIGSRFIYTGSSSPESVVTAPIGSMFMRTDGSSDTTVYFKTSGSSNVGWRSVTGAST